MVSYKDMKEFKMPTGKGLNPCCSGQWSRTLLCLTIMCMTWTVLILVVVDNGLVQFTFVTTDASAVS